MKNKYFFLIILVFFFFGGNTSFAQKSSWAVPEYTKGLKNPFKSNIGATKEGKEIYEQMCVLCHGLTGKGNGEAGLSLDQQPANFLHIKDIPNETDGEIFWKITVGKPPMSSYDELLTEDQRWKLVNYIRELNKKK
ncbi:c-type cytochrome [Flavobacterium soyangense]|uniref:Cytochrome c n=1 Tax=Flavobacterium soyangense TaxID=2023265 RepID=A0A930XTU2_9FLAO|nr:cytochrome c [Flavobacterium soyangense]MBF2707850.1 cytochrome c [Flavobacterium soyangense]